MATDKISVEISISDAQELSVYLERKAVGIDWVLENKSIPARKADDMKATAKLLDKHAANIKKALNIRARATSAAKIKKALEERANVVELKKAE